MIQYRRAPHRCISAKKTAVGKRAGNEEKWLQPIGVIQEFSSREFFQQASLGSGKIASPESHLCHIL